MKRHPVKAEPKQARNSPCNCGSGKKAKRCCLFKQAQRVAERVKEQRVCLMALIAKARKAREEMITASDVSQPQEVLAALIPGGRIPSGSPLPALVRKSKGVRARP